MLKSGICPNNGTRFLFYMQDTVAERLLDRLEDCRRSFERAAVLGGAGARVASRLAGGRAGIQVRAATAGSNSEEGPAACPQVESGKRYGMQG